MLEVPKGPVGAQRLDLEAVRDGSPHVDHVLHTRIVQIRRDAEQTNTSSEHHGIAHSQHLADGGCLGEGERLSCSRGEVGGKEHSRSLERNFDPGRQEYGRCMYSVFAGLATMSGRSCSFLRRGRGGGGGGGEGGRRSSLR